jgi:acetyl esterase/lipase
LSIGVFSSAADTTPVTEVYGTASDGTVLHWVVYTPPSPGPWPAVLVIHGGGFDSGTPDSSADSVTCAQDLAGAEYIAFRSNTGSRLPVLCPAKPPMGVFRINPTT